MEVTYTTNLKLITGNTRTTIPTTTELPLGYMCFGIVNGKASIWGNYDNSVHDLIREGQVEITIVQSTGDSTTAVISQKGVTDALISLKSEILGSLGTAALANIGKSAGNVPVLNSNGKIDETLLPALAITETFVVSNEKSMLSLNAQIGDVAIRTDLNKSYILQSEPATNVDNWKELLTPDCKVISVNGKQGAVVLTSLDITTIFSQASTRENIVSGEIISNSLSKIAKWYNDFGTLAWKSTISFTDIDGIATYQQLPLGNGFQISNEGVINVDVVLNVNEI